MRTLGGTVAILLTAASAEAQTESFVFTGGTQTYTVPPGITRLDVVAEGGSGGTATGSVGAPGARVEAQVAVVPGQVLTVVVGGAGIADAALGRVAGGYNGGGSGSLGEGSGGGATDLQQATATDDYLTTRNALLVAAGGGGGNANAIGGGGGTPNGGNGSGANGASGATQTQPGGSNNTLGQSGSNGNGGDGGSLSLSIGGGGGGGGYYGGGGGYNNGTSTSAGGGGSSWVMAQSAAVVYSTDPTIGAGQMTITAVARPLPVTLSAFTAAERASGAVQLAWATASEYHNAGFAVERSADGRAFVAVHTATGAGNSSQPHHYAWLDEQLPAGTVLLYYRLRQSDFDGTISYSPVQTVALNNGPSAEIELSPNPARTTPTLRGATPGAWVRVFDVQGRQVYAAPASATGTAVLKLPETLPAGLYIVRTGTQTLRLLTQ